MSATRWRVEVSGADGGHIDAAAEDTLLSAFAAAGWQVVAGCRNGVCLACSARLLQGRVRQADQVLDAALQPHDILPCRTYALSPLRLDWPNAFAPGSAGAARDLYCRVLQVEAGALHIELPPGRLPRFLPGQWLLETATRCCWQVLAADGRLLRLASEAGHIAPGASHLRLRGPFAQRPETD